MKRQEWVFGYSSEKLLEAAKAKHESHSIKLKWWEEKKAEITQKVSETGIEIQDSVASSYSNTSGNYGPQIRIDSGLQRDLTECQQKIKAHAEMKQHYAGWVSVFESNPGRTYELEHDDFLFFFG